MQIAKRPDKTDSPPVHPPEVISQTDSLSLRTKLFIGFGGMMAILLAVGGLSLQALDEYRRSVGEIFKDNSASIQAAFEMRSHVRTVNDALENSLDTPHNSALRSTLEPALSGFQANLEIQKRHAVGSEEEAITRQVENLWNNYALNVEKFLAGNTGDQTRDEFYYNILYRDADLLRKETTALGEYNLNTIAIQEGVLADRASTIQYAMIFLIASGATLGAIFLFLVGRFIMQPIGLLSSAVNEIGSGNLDLTIKFYTRDELGQLAQGFNEMAGRLREYRQSDQERLARVRQTTQLAVDSLRDAVFLVDADRQVEVCNETAERLLDIHKGLNISDLGKEWLDRLVDRACHERQPIYPRGFEGTLQIFDEGRERFFLPNAVPITDRDTGELFGVTVVLADVTLLRRLDEMKSSMVATVSHELKTPLTSIRLAIYILLERGFGDLNENQIDLLTTARADCDRLFETLENLLDLSRMQSGQMKLEVDAVPPAALVEEAVSPVLQQFEEAGISLEVAPMADLPPLLVDARLINIVLTNLLSNALKYCSRGEQVVIRGELTEPDMVTLVVEDNGPGLPQEYTERIFDKFFRMPGVPRQGAGLGLAIAREIAEAHQGALTCESALGEGARFELRLPARVGSSQPVPTALPS